MVSLSNKPSSSRPCDSDFPDTNIRRRESGFLAHSELEAWTRGRRAQIDDGVLVVAASDKRYVMRDAVRILGPHGNSNDLFGMTGRIVAIGELLSIGAAVSASTMRLGTAEYDLQFGYILTPLVSPARSA